SEPLQRVDLARTPPVGYGTLSARAVSSAGEHSLHTRGVAGSIPAPPTISSSGAHRFDWQSESLRKTELSQLHRITIDPESLGGRPGIRGLRIRVKDVLDLLAAGASREEILRDYPYLETEDITAAL